MMGKFSVSCITTASLINKMSTSLNCCSLKNCINHPGSCFVFQLYSSLNFAWFKMLDVLVQIVLKGALMLLAVGYLPKLEVVGIIKNGCFQPFS